MLSLEQPLEMQRPPIVRFGAGQLATLADWIAAAGARRPFVVALEAPAPAPIRRA